MATSRTDFNETWLFEMPHGVGSFETFNTLVYNITDIINNGGVPISIVVFRGVTAQPRSHPWLLATEHELTLHSNEP